MDSLFGNRTAWRGLHLTMIMVASFLGGDLSSEGPKLFPEAAAQEQQKTRKNSGRRTKAVDAHSPQGIKILQAAQEHIDAENYAGAEIMLDGLLGNPGKYKGIDVAIAYKFRGYARVSRDNYGAALSDFEKAIAHPSLPDYDQLDLQYNMAQIALAQGQVSKAIRALEAWFRKAENPNAGAYMFAARAYAQADRWGDAERNVEIGLSKMATPEENHLRVASVIYLQRQKKPQSPNDPRAIGGLFPRQERIFHATCCGLF